MQYCGVILSRTLSLGNTHTQGEDATYAYGYVKSHGMKQHALKRHFYFPLPEMTPYDRNRECEGR